MPFKSKAQRAFMFANHPKMAKEFEEATPEGAKLPEHVGHGEPGHFCDGGCAGYSAGGEVAEEKDPSVMPEDVKEYVRQAHKEKHESRPDENWRISMPQKKAPVAGYKKDEEAEKAAAESEPLAMAKGGVVPGYAPGGEVGDMGDGFDPNADLKDLAPLGSGMLAPAPAAPVAPPVQPVVNAPAPPVVDKTPAVPVTPTAPAPTDQDFMDRANKVLGLGPQDQAAFLKLLGNKSNLGQIGAGVAGIGDAIASGGTLGKVNPGNLGKAEDIIQNKEKTGIEGMQTIRGNQEKAEELSLKLQANDPNSPLSKYSQKAYAGVGKKIGLDLSHASASLIGDITGKGVQELQDEAELALKQATLGIQKEQVDATIANQKATRAEAEATRSGEAAKTLAGRGILSTLGSFIPGAGKEATKILEKQAGGAGAPAVGGPVSVNSKTEYEALPSGTHYVDSYGTEKVKK